MRLPAGPLSNENGRERLPRKHSGNDGKKHGLILGAFPGCDWRGLDARPGRAVIGLHLEGSPEPSYVICDQVSEVLVGAVVAVLLGIRAMDTEEVVPPGTADSRLTSVWKSLQQRVKNIPKQGGIRADVIQENLKDYNNPEARFQRVEESIIVGHGGVGNGREGNPRKRYR